MSKDMTIYRAFMAARAASEQLLIAHMSEGYAFTFHTTDATKELMEAANILGFDLVPREAKKEAA